ncbi:MAG: glycerate kinase [Nitrospirae bacterium]|nr:glycerate kinase [Nitrospirota bacterium]
MKIVIAPDSFKGSLSAGEVAAAIEEGVRKVFPKAEIRKVPLADGGEGTVRALVEATGGKIKEVEVTGPLGEKVKANYGILGDEKTAVIEMATASGLPLVPPRKRDPSRTTTYGTGELIKAALQEGCREFIVGIGGSATTDGGAGMAQALGAKLLDEKGQDIGFGGGELKKLERIDLAHFDRRIKESKVTVASDVDNPLWGEKGAARVYGPQKGATPEMVEELDKALRHFAEIIKRDLHKDVANIPGAGAAGGLGAGLMAFLEANLRPGIDIVMEVMKLEKNILDADLVITGEGKMDKQTIYGKAPYGVAKLAGRHKKKVIGICGMLGEGAEILYQHGFQALFPNRIDSMSREEAMQRAKELTTETAARAMHTLRKDLET